MSVSAERVEGFSAPLQFMFASAYYALGGSGWARFLDAQVVLGVMATGYFTARFLQAIMPCIRPLQLTLAAALSAVLASWPWAAAGWFVSGMENSITVPLLAAAMAALARLGGTRGWALGTALGLAGSSRTEWLVLLAPALILVAAVGWKRVVPRRTAAIAIAVALSLWIFTQSLRLATFGSLLPNSAAAQGKSSLSVAGVVGLVVIAAGLLLALWVLSWWPQTARLLPLLASMWLAFALATQTIDGRQRPLAEMAGLVGALLLMGLAMFAVGLGQPLAWLSWLVIGMTPVAQYLVLGPARLDDFRLMSMSLLLLAPAGGVLLIAILDRHKMRPDASLIPVLLVGALSLGAYFLGSSYTKAPRYLCCGIEDYAVTLETADSVAPSIGLPRVILANPDLGKVSFAKATVTVDLGLLGDPLLRDARAAGSEASVELLNEVIVPDVVVIHGIWLCNYRDWVESDAFIQAYMILEVTPGPNGGVADCPMRGARVTYIRKQTPEFAQETELASLLARRPAEAEQLVGTSLQSCAGEPGEPLRCQWIRRAIQRASPELREAGTYGQVVDVVRRLSPLPDFDRLLLTTPPGWSDQANAVLDLL